METSTIAKIWERLSGQKAPEIKDMWDEGHISEWADGTLHIKRNGEWPIATKEDLEKAGYEPQENGKINYKYQINLLEKNYKPVERGKNKMSDDPKLYRDFENLAKKLDTQNPVELGEKERFNYIRLLAACNAHTFKEAGRKISQEEKEYNNRFYKIKAKAINNLIENCSGENEFIKFEKTRGNPIFKNGERYDQFIIYFRCPNQPQCSFHHYLDFDQQKKINKENTAPFGNWDGLEQGFALPITEYKKKLKEV